MAASDKIPEISAKAYAYTTLYFMAFLWIWGDWGFGAAIWFTAIIVAAPIALGRYKLTSQPKIETHPAKVIAGGDWDEWEKEL